MKTRQEYLNNECTFNEYYGQFVSNYITSLVKDTFGIETIKEALQSDEHLNNIPLAKWDSIARFVNNRTTAISMKECGDWLSNAGQVCILKEAARRLVSCK